MLESSYIILFLSMTVEPSYIKLLDALNTEIMINYSMFKKIKAFLIDIITTVLLLALIGVVWLIMLAIKFLRLL